VLSLIRDGAGVNARGAAYGNTALMEAAAGGHTDTVRTLLEKGGDVDATDNAGRTSLMEAAFEGYTDTVRVLLEKGANINAHDKEGWTPLFWAAFSRRTDTVRFLLEKGAEVNAKNKYQDTPLIHAAYGGDTDTVSVMLENHADINAKDDMGRTALIEAARQGHLDTVRVLLANGAAVGVQASDGSTALSLAEKLHYTEVATLLKNAPSRGPEGKTPETKPAVTPKPENKAPETRSVTVPPPSAPFAPVGSVKPPPQASPADPVAAAALALEKKSKAQAFYRMGLSMRIVEDLWPQSGRTAERAAASILGDLTKVGAPDDLIVFAQQASTRLAVPPEERKGSVPVLVSELHKRLDTYCLTQPGGQFFYTSGGVTYDMSLLGQELSKPGHEETKTEETRKNIAPLAANMAAQCVAITECKVRALSYITDAASLLQQSPMLPSDGATLQKLCDQIGVALGTDEPLSSR
jgi:ankyrin repeat protein